MANIIGNKTANKSINWNEPQLALISLQWPNVHIIEWIATFSTSFSPLLPSKVIALQSASYSFSINSIKLRFSIFWSRDGGGDSEWSVSEDFSCVVLHNIRNLKTIIRASATSASHVCLYICWTVLLNFHPHEHEWCHRLFTNVNKWRAFRNVDAHEEYVQYMMKLREMHRKT